MYNNSTINQPQNKISDDVYKQQRWTPANMNNKGGYCNPTSSQSIFTIEAQWLNTLIIFGNMGQIKSIQNYWPNKRMIQYQGPRIAIFVGTPI